MIFTRGSELKIFTTGAGGGYTVCLSTGGAGIIGKIYFVEKVSFKGALKEHFTQKCNSVIISSLRCLLVGWFVCLSAASQRTSDLICHETWMDDGSQPTIDPINFQPLIAAEVRTD